MNEWMNEYVHLYSANETVLSMRVSWAKTKLQNIGSGVRDHPSNITVDGNTVEQVDNFIYLGSTQSSNGGSQLI